MNCTKARRSYYWCLRNPNKRIYWYDIPGCLRPPCPTAAPLAPNDVDNNNNTHTWEACMLSLSLAPSVLLSSMNWQSECVCVWVYVHVCVYTMPAIRLITCRSLDERRHVLRPGTHWRWTSTRRCCCWLGTQKGVRVRAGANAAHTILSLNSHHHTHAHVRKQTKPDAWVIYKCYTRAHTCSH